MSLLCGVTYSTSSAMFVTGIMRLFRSNFPEKNIFGSGHTMQQFRSTVYRHHLGKMTQKIFFSWFVIPSFITRTCVFFIRPLVLSFNQIYLSLHFDEYSCGRLIFELISLAMRRLFYSIRNPKVETTGAIKCSIKPLPSCTRTRFFVLLGKNLVLPGQVKHHYMTAISAYFLLGWKCVP